MAGDNFIEMCVALSKNNLDEFYKAYNALLAELPIEIQNDLDRAFDADLLYAIKEAKGK